MFPKLGMIMVIVSEIDRSVAFYRDVLGLTVRFAMPEFAELDMGGVALGLHPQGDHVKVNPNVGMSFGFYVSDLDATLAQITGRGAAIAYKLVESWGTIAAIKDPDGYEVQFCQMNAH